jgi:hypothetical protein
MTLSAIATPVVEYNSSGRLLIPVGASDIQRFNASQTLAANSMSACLVRVPRDGVIRQLWAGTAGTVGGAAKGVIFDTAEPTVLRWLGASITLVINSRLDLGDPAYPVRKGQLLYIGVLSNNGTQIFLRTAGANALGTLYAGSMGTVGGDGPDGNILLKASFTAALGTYTPTVGTTSVAEASRAISASTMIGTFGYVADS